MSYFTKVSAADADGDLDLTKHVNFTSGMILGVDDFTQEFAYLAGRDQWLARDALGYGTISGLSVRIEEDAEKGHRVMILPGAAVSPRGQFICVPSAQCAYLNQWLAAARAEDLVKYVKTINAPVTSPPTSPPPAATNEITLYVVLCYRDCATDNVPIPGEPCRSEDELTAASRITDDFSLELRFESPNQPEEAKVREYVEWLKKIKISETDASTPIADFIEAIRARWLAPASPPVTSPTVLQIRTTDISEYMRTAFRVWVTELRIILSERKTGCAVEMTGGAKLEDCVLLAELRIPLVPISTGWEVSDTKEIELDEKKRPFLLHLRILQEWMLYAYEQTLAIAPTTDPITPTLLDSLSDVNVPTPVDGQVLFFEGGEWIAKTPAASGGLDTAGGDLSGTYPNPTVSQLQGKPVDEKTPTKNDILTWDGAKWIPRAVQVESPLLLPFATIDVFKPIGIFDIWFNVDAPNNAAEIRKEDLDVKHITPLFELDDETSPDSPFLQKFEVDVQEFGRMGRNFFRIQLKGFSPKFTRLRFDFDIENINVISGTKVLSVQKYARRNNIRFLGESKSKVTIFVRFP